MKYFTNQRLTQNILSVMKQFRLIIPGKLLIMKETLFSVQTFEVVKLWESIWSGDKNDFYVTKYI